MRFELAKRCVICLSLSRPIYKGGRSEKWIIYVFVLGRSFWPGKQFGQTISSQLPPATKKPLSIRAKDKRAAAVRQVAPRGSPLPDKCEPVMRAQVLSIFHTSPLFTTLPN